MNREEIIRMAMDSANATGTIVPSAWNDPMLEHFANAVYAAGAAAEREACAKVCDWLPINDPHGQWHNDDMMQASLICAAAIRARGDK